MNRNLQEENVKEKYMSDDILKINNLSISIWKKQILKNVSFSVPDKKITCLVGESGSGKSMTVSSVLGLLPRGTEISDESVVEFRGNSIFSIYQDPMNSFNPSLRTGRQLFDMAEGYIDGLTKAEFRKNMKIILERLHFANPEEALRKYPFELSGGMLQRMMIACAIFVKPSLIIADEPTTALDVSIQKEIMRELRAINKEYNIAVIVVTHDFGVVAELADSVIVMQKGMVVEQGDVFSIFDNPQHEYTKKLLEASFKTFNVQEGGTE